MRTATLVFAAICLSAPIGLGCSSDTKSPTPTGGDGGGTSAWRSVVGADATFAQTFDDARWSTRHLDVLGGHALLSVACVGNLYGWTAGEGGALLHTTDGGAAWTVDDAHLGAVALRAVRFADRTHGVVAGDAGALAVTDDGVTWRAIVPSPTTVTLRAAAAANDLRIVVGDAGTVLRSTDAGRTWLPPSSITTADLHGVATDPGAHVVYAVDTAGTIWSSTNAGETFTRDYDAHVALDAVAISDTGSRILAVGAHGTALLKTTSWTTQQTSTTSDLHAALIESETAYAAGDEGTLLTLRNTAWSRIPLSTTSRLTALEDL